MFDSIRFLIPEKLQRKLADSVVDVIVEKTKHLPKAAKLSSLIESLRSDSESRKRFSDALIEASDKFVNEYSIRDSEVVKIISLDKDFFEKKELQEALVDALKRPDLFAKENPDVLSNHFTSLLTGIDDQSRINDAIRFYLKCLVESVWLMPEFGDVYDRLFRKYQLEKTSEQIEIAELQASLTSKLFDAIQNLTKQLPSWSKEIADSNLTLTTKNPIIEARQITEGITSLNSLVELATPIKSVKNIQTISNERLKVSSFLGSKYYMKTYLRDWENGEIISLDYIKRFLNESTCKILITGKAGTGKSIALIKLFLEEKHSDTYFITSQSFRNYLTSVRHNRESQQSNNCRIYIDGLDEVHPMHDKAIALTIANILQHYHSAIVSARSGYVDRPDVKSGILTVFDKIFEIELWDKNVFRQFLLANSQEEPSFLPYIFDINLDLTPMFAAMTSIIFRSQNYFHNNSDSKTKRKQGMSPTSDISNLTMLYQNFIESWYHRELQKHPHPSHAITFVDACEYWRKMATELHRIRTSPIVQAPNIAKHEIPEDNELVNSIFKFSRLNPERIEDFIHNTLIDYFCALENFNEITAFSETPISANSILFLPNFFEINIFIRGLLLSLQNNAQTRKSVYNRLIDLYNNSISISLNGNNTSEYLLRNNVMYILGRLPQLSLSEINTLEKYYETEKHPLVRYTIGMNGIFHNNLKLTTRIINATINPNSDDAQSIKEANLFCHLHYYGDIAELRMPPDEMIDWSLTKIALLRHFDPAYSYYQPFWLIDFVTCVQLEKHYGDSKEFLMSIANKFVHKLKAQSSFTPLYRDVWQYATSELPYLTEMENKI